MAVHCTYPHPGKTIIIMASQILPPNTLVVVVGVIMELRPIITPPKDFGPNFNFLKWFSPKQIWIFFYKADIPAFHTHFIDFGGVGTNETG